MGTSLAAVLYAVVIGSNAPTGPDVQPLRFADDDAVASAQLLREAGAQVTLLADFDAETRALHAGRGAAASPDGPPTRAALDRALDDLAARMTADRAAGRRVEAFFVYAGHGDVDHGEGYVQLADGRLGRAELYRRVLPRLAQAHRVHVVVDACKSYFFALERGAAGQRAPHAGHFVDALGPELFPQVGFVLSTSTGADSHEWEEFQGGVFSHEVRSALRGAADADRDGAISYAELGAFVARANAAVPNARFRPRFTVLAPRGEGAGLKTALLRWPDGGPARTATIDVPLSRFLVEDENGTRLLDAHFAEAGGVVHVPASALYLRPEGSTEEIAIPAGTAPVLLSTLARAPQRVARRGALQVAFRALFAEPFGAADVALFVSLPPGPLEPAPPTLAQRALPIVKWTALGVGLAGVLAGGACTLAAVETRRVPGGLSEASLAQTNARIDRLNGAAIGLYTVGAVALVTSVITWVVPRLTRRLHIASKAGSGITIELP